LDERVPGFGKDLWRPLPFVSLWLCLCGGEDNRSFAQQMAYDLKPQSLQRTHKEDLWRAEPPENRR
jgi:hypothetical protein